MARLFISVRLDGMRCLSCGLGCYDEVFLKSFITPAAREAISTILTLLMLPDRVGRSHEWSKSHDSFIIKCKQHHSLNCNQNNMLRFLNPKVFVTLKMSSDAWEGTNYSSLANSLFKKQNDVLLFFFIPCAFEKWWQKIIFRLIHNQEFQQLITVKLFWSSLTSVSLSRTE